MWSSEATKGENCHIHETAVFFGKCIIGNEVTIHPYTIIGGQPLSAKLVMEPYPHYIPRISKRPVIIEDRVVILNHATIQTGVHIGRGTIIGNKCHIGHDSDIGEYCRIHGGSKTAGHVIIGNGVTLEPGVSIARRVTVGSHSHIGLGSVVLKNIPPNQTYFGNPARNQIEQQRRSKLIRRLLLEEHMENVDKSD